MAGTQAERFMGKLDALGGAASNGALSAALGWSTPTYDKVKTQLLAEGAIKLRRGRGGGVARAGLSDGDMEIASPGARLAATPPPKTAAIEREQRTPRPRRPASPPVHPRISRSRR